MHGPSSVHCDSIRAHFVQFLENVSLVVPLKLRDVPMFPINSAVISVVILGLHSLLFTGGEKNAIWFPEFIPN